MGEASDGPSSARATAFGLALGLAVLYTVWGSTYLAIRVAVETIPPFLMAGCRFVLAGLLLFGWARMRGVEMPSRTQWRWAILTGGLLLLGGNGGVVWAEKRVPSGLAALLITTTPFWMALFDWLRPGGTRPRLATWAGLIAGFAGTAALAFFGKDEGGESIETLRVLALLGAPIAWALGSVIAKHAPRPDSPFLTTALQMLCGGGLLLLASGAAGEWNHFDPAAVTLKSIGGAVYLLIFGSLLAMTVYTWLLHHTEPTLISTYAFVNPVIAVLLGWFLAGETLNSSTLGAGAVIVAAVAWLIAVQWRSAGRSRKARAMEAAHP